MARSLEPILPRVRGVVDAIWARYGRGADSTPRNILFVSAEPGAGTTTIAAATALAFAWDLQVEVNLLEADVSSPTVAGLLDIDPTPGLADLLDRSAVAAECRHRVPDCPQLAVVPAGTRRAPVAGELAREPAVQFLSELHSTGRFLFVDAPPILGRAESRLLASRADGAVLVLRSRSTRRAHAKRALEVLDGLEVELLGTILNDYVSDVPFVKP